MSGRAAFAVMRIAADAAPQMNEATFISEALREPVRALTYEASRRVRAAFPTKGIVETDDAAFDPSELAAAGRCTMTLRPHAHAQRLVEFEAIGEPHRVRFANAWFDVAWEGRDLAVLLLSWTENCCTSTLKIVVADDEATARAFFDAVCTWTTEVRGEVLVFEGGGWQKSAALFAAIEHARLDDVVLDASLKRELVGDFERFFASRAVYETYGVPWKRGVLFVGPPGNGKTQTVKALVRAMGRPCLYVKSLRAKYRTDHDCIRAVFERARKTTPCLLVLEDLDSLIDDKNRSFFLNELDGFAANTGIVAVATTNHPERLDPAILDRPSRFDRTYDFALPTAALRADYARLWNRTLHAAMRLDDASVAAIAEATEGFSFAYVKELFVSAMTRWIASPREGGLGAEMLACVGALREQMRAARDEPVRTDDDDDE
jgi:hypothetical protein